MLVFAGWLCLIESSSLSSLKPTFFNGFIYLYVCLYIYFNGVVYSVYIMWKNVNLLRSTGRLQPDLSEFAKSLLSDRLMLRTVIELI